jgi:hypothetical protein
MQFGADGLREMLAAGDTDRETLMRDASVLQQMDSPSVAEIILEAAYQAPPAAILRCPYSPDDRANYQAGRPVISARGLTLARVPQNGLYRPHASPKKIGTGRNGPFTVSK